jgi:hypothetical protein
LGVRVAGHLDEGDAFGGGVLVVCGHDRLA